MSYTATNQQSLHVLPNAEQPYSFKKHIFQIFSTQLLPRLSFLINLFIENDMYPVAAQKVLPVAYNAAVPVQSLSFIFRGVSVQADFVAIEDEHCIKTFGYMHGPNVNITTQKLFTPESFTEQFVEDFIDDCICRVKQAVK